MQNLPAMLAMMGSGGAGGAGGLGHMAALSGLAGLQGGAEMNDFLMLQVRCHWCCRLRCW